MTYIGRRDKITVLTPLKTKWKMDINCCHNEIVPIRLQGR